jgi:hypothetical protein
MLPCCVSYCLNPRFVTRLANRTGLFTSDFTYLDGSNLGKNKKDVSKGLSEEEANGMFRFSEQTWLAHDRDPLLQDMMSRVMRLGLLPDYVRKLSEQMQVVYYRPHGHYECHHDSESRVRARRRFFRRMGGCGGFLPSSDAA